VRGKAPDRSLPRPWLEHLRTASAQLADDPHVLPPTLPGQLILVRPRRQLTYEHETRIRDRVLRGQDTLKTHAFTLAAERVFTKVTAHSLVRMARLALAARDADGEDLVPADVLDDLPRFGRWTGEVLRRAAMLGARRVHRQIKARNPTVARSYVDCDCWGVHPQPRCSSCQGWRFHLGHPLGTGAASPSAPWTNCPH
jgi:hypothetical protein